jgi:hypothetical protein
MKTFLVVLLCLSVYAGEPDEAYSRLVRSKTPEDAVALAKLGEAAAPQLTRGLERGDKISSLIAHALIEHPVPATAPTLRGRLWKVDQVTGYFAAKALGKIPSSENAAALAALLPSETNGFWELSSGGKPRLQDLYDAQRNRYTAEAPTNMPNIRVAYAAMLSLGELGGDLAANTLLRGLTNDQYLIRQACARGLGALRNSVATGHLTALIQHDPVLIVRQAAEQSLARMRGESPAPPAQPELPGAIAFIKTRHRSDATFGFRDSYFFPKTPRYHSGENLYTLTPPHPTGAVKNLTQLTDGEVQSPEVSFDGQNFLFAMRRNRATDGFHIFEINIDGSGLRQITDGNCNDTDPCYLPGDKIAFSSDRAGYQEYYHQERSRVLYTANLDGAHIRQISFNPNQDYEPLALRDGRLIYSSYRFYAQDGSEGPLPGLFMGLARIETVLRVCNPDGSSDQLFYGSMRGSYYCPLRPMPFGDQFAGWHPLGYHVGVSVSLQREMPDGRILCATPAGLALIHPELAPLDCEQPVFPEVLNLAGGEEVYIHNYDEMNPIGRFTSPYPAGNNWAFVSHAPWHDLSPHGYGIYLLNLQTRELSLIYDDPTMSDVDPIAIKRQSPPDLRASTLATNAPRTGRILCNSILNSNLPFDKNSARYVRVLAAELMGESISANAAFRTRVLGTAALHDDGSFYVEVPADTPLRFELLDANGRMLVHETEFNYVRPGETKGCVGCHERHDHSPLASKPVALEHPPVRTLRSNSDLIYMGRPDRSYNYIYRD